MYFCVWEKRRERGWEVGSWENSDLKVTINISDMKKFLIEFWKYKKLVNWVPWSLLKWVQRCVCVCVFKELFFRQNLWPKKMPFWVDTDYLVKFDMKTFEGTFIWLGAQIPSLRSLPYQSHSIWGPQFLHKIGMGGDLGDF